MENLSALVPCLLLTLGVALAEDGQTSTSRPLPQWLTGIIAVCGFLFLAFVVVLVKKAWCDDPQRKKDKNMEKLNEFIQSNTYERSPDVRRKGDEFAMEVIEDKATAM